jgi:hypothetical protein
MATRNIVPRATGEGSLGTSAKHWGNIYADNGNIAGRNIATDGSTLDTLGNSVTTLQNDVTTLQHAYAGAKAAATVADMTDHNQIYVYVGSETGYTNGNWYYWNGTAWTSGGVYNATALETDKTLTISGAAADAKVTGDKITEITNDLDGLAVKKIIDSLYGGIRQDSGTTISLAYNAFNDLVWDFKRSTGFVGAYVRIGVASIVKTKKYMIHFLNNYSQDLRIRVFMTDYGSNWAVPTHAVIIDDVVLTPGEIIGLPIDGSKYDEITSPSTSFASITLNLLSTNDLGEDVNIIYNLMEMVDNKLGDKSFAANAINADNAYCAEKLIGFIPDDYYTKNEIDTKMATSGDYITCWGDSLTAGGGWTERLAELSGRTLYNAGTGGESARTIVARQGADIMITNNITIPETTTAILISSMVNGGIDTQEGYKATPLLQGGSNHVNPCKIGDVVGTLTWTGANYSDVNGTWTFTRANIGDAVTIARPTAIRTNYDMNKNSPYLMVIFIGQNGGYTNIDDLIRQHRLMIEHSNSKYHIVLGLSSGSAADRSAYESAMNNEFGRYFISLRQYLAHPIYENGEIVSCYGLADQGLSPDPSFTYDGKTTLQEIAAGIVPHQILADSVHYTANTKLVIGNMLYKKCCELGIF